MGEAGCGSAARRQTSGVGQLSLLGHEEIGFDASFAKIERIQLEDGAWLELARGWVRGHAALFEEVRRTLAFRADRRLMYEREVDVPRLYASMPSPAGSLGVIDEMRAALDPRYATSFERVSFALYRSGRDSVAWHGDTVARKLPEALVATVSLGASRRFFLRRAGGGRSIVLSLGWGDLLVMGGSCQRTYQHAIPKVAHADPRISIMFRPVWVDPSPHSSP